VAVFVLVAVFVHCGTSVAIGRTPVNVLFVSSISVITEAESIVILTDAAGIYCIHTEPLVLAAIPATAISVPSISIVNAAASWSP